MSDQSFHEIQLSGKQLVFFFMCAVILTVVVFLFGVSVGRDVRGTGAAAQTAQTVMPSAPADTTTPAPAAAAPPATQPAPNELSYAEALGGGSDDPSKVTPPAPPAEEPSAPATKSAEPPKAAKEESHPAPPKAAPAKTAPVKASPAKAAPAKAPMMAGWAVQVGAFNANAVASQEVAKLQGKGYPAFVFTESETTPGPRYKVRVGPYSAKADADRILKSLTKEGFQPLLKR
jgi:cell division protein FtsN